MPPDPSHELAALRNVAYWARKAAILCSCELTHGKTCVCARRRLPQALAVLDGLDD